MVGMTLRPLLLAGSASHREVAAHLNIHPRTMGRRLEEENHTFEQLKDEVRLAVARELGPTDVVVALLPDSGRGYLGKIFNDDWMRANGEYFFNCVKRAGANVTKNNA